jgi:NAD(P)-dependent dehydrogenase (short-subunit alcohol dehydrogenase family)
LERQQCRSKAREQRSSRELALGCLLAHDGGMHNAPVALVTGASRGIGRAIALHLGQAGYAVGVNYLQSQAAASEVVDHIKSNGGPALTLQGDVAKTTDRVRLVHELLARFGRVDLLINNAGITSPGRHDLLEATEESWETVLGTNLKGPFFLSQLVSRKMVKLIAAGSIQRGTIINVSSISAYAVSTNRGDYCIAKAGLRMMTQLYAARLAQERIRVYEVCPGVIESDMTAPVREKYDRLIAEGLSPIRRWGTPEDVARAVVALASDAFPFSTGDCLNVDGGFHIRRL